MRARDVVLFFSLIVVAAVAAGEPDRAKSLSVHMLPDRVAQIDGRSGGFTVASQTYADAAQLVAYFRRAGVGQAQHAR